MSDRDEAAEAIRDALAAVADGSGQEETVADALRDWLTDRADVFADALAAAGYTVTRRDEVERLRKVLAYEARVIEAQTDLAAIKGQRRQILDEQIRLMRLEALGKPQLWSGRWEKELDRIEGWTDE